MKKLRYIAVLFLFSGCISFFARSETEDYNDNIPLKYPVVLVHGIMANDRERGIHFWGRIPDILKEKGITVYYGNTKPWGKIEQNAKILRDTIEKVLHETGSEKVNIIAHSKGGLDSRYLLYQYGFEDKVASLTTISTPHKGAELADFIYHGIEDSVDSVLITKAIEAIEHLLRDSPDLIGVNYQLTTMYINKFNQMTGMVDDNVYFQSLYTTTKNNHDNLLFFYSYNYINKVAGANDGVVSAYSSRWGGNYRQIPGSLSHMDIIDIRRKNIRGIDIPGIYVDIVKDLYERGF